MRKSSQFQTSLVQRKVLYAVVLVAVVAVLALVVLSFRFSNQQTSNTSSSLSSNASSFQVLKTNVTVSYDVECMVLEAVGHTCPTMARNATGASPSSLRGVELIAYQRTDYYAGSFSSGPYGQLSVTSRLVHQLDHLLRKPFIW